MHKLMMALMIVLLATISLKADINDARLTEIYIGLPGADGTVDWIEVTNMGNTPLDTGDLMYDDINPSVATGGILQSIILLPGESAVFLLSAQADNQDLFGNSSEEFLAVWIPFDGDFLGLSGGGGNLGQGGDEANLLNPNTGEIIDTIAYGPYTLPNTIERTGPGSMDHRASVLGENGAFASQTFIDPATGQIALGPDGMPIMLIGSPGIYQTKSIVLGDINCDGQVNLLDVNPFIDLITSGSFDPKGDMNGDGSVDLLDVNLFIAALTGG